MNRDFDFRTEAVQAGAGTDLDSTTTGDVVAPIHLATTHEMATPGESDHGYKYVRFGNPTRDAGVRTAPVRGDCVASERAAGTPPLGTRNR